MKAIKIIGIVILIITAIVLVLYFYIKFKSNNVVDNKNLEASIDKQANLYIQNGNSFGLVVGIVKNGKTFIKGYGTINKEKQILPDSLSIFELASTSKLFTTSTLQLLADEGQLKLDDKIQTIVNDKVKISSLGQNTTLLHLATHLSGFPSLPNSFIAKMKDETNPYKDLVTQDIYDYLKTCEGKQPEGNFEYSNFGMGLLGHLLELKSNTKYEKLVIQKLLDPLQMKNTFVTVDSVNKKRIVQGYDEKGNLSPIWIDNVLTGAGSFLSNASDMVNFIKANLKEDETSISKSLIHTHKRQLNGETGLGWILPSSADKLLGNKHIVWHNGMAGGYSSFLAIDKTNGYGVIILSNKAIDASTFGMKMLRTIRTQSWKE
jgi:serine-type D-Ala-D-Ala carboxypeptidase/endopeptidase